MRSIFLLLFVLCILVAISAILCIVMKAYARNRTALKYVCIQKDKC